MAAAFTVFKGSSAGKIVESQSKHAELAPNEVLLDITHSGVCGTDAHYLYTDMVLGHEGVGVAKAIGGNVKAVKIGDRLGFGYAKDGCGYCKQCEAGYTFHCENSPRVFAANDFDQGSFATQSVWPETRLVHIPDEIASENAGPFMCAGQTVFVPLWRNNVKPTDRVGVIGIGGLGHLAIQFAAAWGCEVVVFSSSDNKREEAFGFGATEFVDTKNLDPSKVKKLNHLIVTTSAKPDWSLYIEFMAPFGKIYPLTVAHGNLEFPYLPLVLKELSIHGICSSSAAEVRKMLEFIVAHGIKPRIEKFPLSVEGITEAFEKLDKGKIRYRGVLEAKLIES